MLRPDNETPASAARTRPALPLLEVRRLLSGYRGPRA
jgi:hypothetical protein